MNKKIIISSIVLTIIVVIVLIFITFQETSIEEIKDSVVMIETYDESGASISTGSGFCAYKENYIVTNFHVIKGAKTIKVIDDNKNEYEIKKIEILKEADDLAILSGNFSFTPIKIDNSNLKAGDEVVAIGSPKGELNTVSTGIISNADDEYEIRITAPISPGSSGGVLLNNKHRVIGITYASYNSIEAQNINYAINVNYLEKMYDKLTKNETFDLPNKLYSINNIESFVQIAPSKIYYSVDNLEKFYNSTSAKEIFENSLKEQDLKWYDIYSGFSQEEQYECFSIIESFQDKYQKDFLESKIKIQEISELIKHYTIEEIAYNVAIKEYQYAIVLEKASKLSSIKELSSMINSLPIKDGQKVLLKYCFIYKDIDAFSDKENTDLINYLFDEKYSSNSSNIAAAVLEKMGYNVEFKNHTYVTYWD